MPTSDGNKIIDATEAESSASYALQVVTFNVKQLLAARNLTSATLAEYMGLTGGGISTKIAKGTWKLDDVVKMAAFFETTVADIMDDTLMRMLTKGDFVDSTEYRRLVGVDSMKSRLL